MENAKETGKQSSGESKFRIPRSASFWVSILTFLMLFGLLFTGVVIAIVRLIRMLVG
jgi:hypothetical protein